MIDFGIIAAGDGNRIKEEGSLCAKPLVEIQGKPMIGRLIDLMSGCGANSIGIIVNSDMPEVWDYLQNFVPEKKCELKLISGKTPSSMHSFAKVVELVDPADKFVVTTVDTIFRPEDFRRYTEKLMECGENIDGVMGVTAYIDDEKPLYVETSEDMKIRAYLDEKLAGVKYVSAGIYGLRRSSIPVLESCLEKGMTRMRNFQRALVEKGLNLFAYDLGKVLDVDHILDISKANAFLK